MCIKVYYSSISFISEPMLKVIFSLFFGLNQAPQTKLKISRSHENISLCMCISR